MPVTIKIGALPNASVKAGSRDLLKAHKQGAGDGLSDRRSSSRRWRGRRCGRLLAMRSDILPPRQRAVHFRSGSSSSRTTRGFVTVRTGPARRGARDQDRPLRTPSTRSAGGLQVTDSIVEPPPRESPEVCAIPRRPAGAPEAPHLPDRLGIAWGTVACGAAGVRRRPRAANMKRSTVGDRIVISLGGRTTRRSRASATAAHDPSAAR